MNRLVYIAHPWAADPAGNAIELRRICAEVMAAGDIPIAPPLMFSWLDDSVPADRARGMEMGLHLLHLCREVRVYAEPSLGMRAEIEAARQAGIQVRWMADLDTAGEWMAEKGP